MFYRFTQFKEIMHTIALRYFVRKKLPKGHIGIGSHIHTPSLVSEGSLDNIYLGDNCNIDWNNVLYCVNAKFIMKSNSGAAVGLTVITGNHTREVSEKKGEKGNKNLVGKDIVVEEDVWIAANVTLLAGAHIGRGAIVGAGSVLRTCNVPPYAIVMGNPAKVVGFRYTPMEVIAHEETLYPKEMRLPIELLKENYNKYFRERKKEIKDFTRL
jgi:acetyltransferase-like isoleucine patch superfamily enzyme